MTRHPIPRDTRGIVGPVRLSRAASLNRYPARGELDGLVGGFWAVRWSLPEAHLVRDFRAALGQTPAAYARARQRESSADTGQA